MQRNPRCSRKFFSIIPDLFQRFHDEIECRRKLTHGVGMILGFLLDGKMFADGDKGLGMQRRRRHSRPRLAYNTAFHFRDLKRAFSAKETRGARSRKPPHLDLLCYRAPMSGRLSDYDYVLPEELIAQRPLARRDESRMMVLHRSEQRVEHRTFAEIGGFLSPGDLLVLNNTRVLSARRFSDDGRIEFLFLEQLGPRRWMCLVKPGRKMRMAAVTKIHGVQVRVEEICPDGERVISIESEENLLEGGAVPLPPYIGRPSDPSDLERYQTVFAETPGAIAAPTAGLHFTSEVLAKLPHTFITLHVGAGTFQPVKSEQITDHRMHEERFSISESAASAINASDRVIAIGTTTVRVLESAKRREGQLIAQEGKTDLFIHPPRQIQHIDCLLTNFHLPRSTLLMLVSAFAGRELLLTAYAEAIRERYRFYSYGDCMLIL